MASFVPPEEEEGSVDFLRGEIKTQDTETSSVAVPAIAGETKTAMVETEVAAAKLGVAVDEIVSVKAKCLLCFIPSFIPSFVM